MSSRKKASVQLAAKNVTVFMRKYLCLTQQELAKACGLTAMDISKLERRDHGIQLYKLQKLAAYFSVPLDAIISNRFDLIPQTYYEKET